MILNLLDAMHHINDTEGHEAARRWLETLTPEERNRVFLRAVVDVMLITYICEHPKRVLGYQQN
jgi:hypothetical protein